VPQNIELKVACSATQFAAIRDQLDRRPLRSIETLIQVDTYFRTPCGRLKLREIESARGRTAELIQYNRPDHAGARTSTYPRVDVKPELKPVLLAALGELVTVRKRRTVAIWQATRVHLDEVDGLGAFVELETVLSDAEGSKERGRAEYDNVVEWLGLASLEPIPGSYSDLLIEKGQHA
jgi:predicted adenylyl cyclase CyaB